MHRIVGALCWAWVVACGRQDSTVGQSGGWADARPQLAADGAMTPSHAAPGATSTLGFLPLTVLADNALATTNSVRSLEASPFGIASSNLSSKRLAGWLPTIRSAGVAWLRGFDVAAAETRLTEIEQQGLHVSGVLQWSPPGTTLSFPVNHLPTWSHYVEDLVSRTKGRVRHWEVWNEPPNFSQDKSPDSYAKVVVAAYNAVKRVDATIRVGIAAKSNHVQWLESVIRAGAKSHFDYVTLHPYEVLDVVAEGGEALFINIVPTVRAMLRAHDPQRAHVPILFTELGTPVDATTTQEQQAARLLKAYTLGIAQGASRIHWFEGQDGDSGAFGLLDPYGKKRASYTALSTLVATLGAVPDYQGWVIPTEGAYGFVFRSAAGVVLVAWTSPAASKSLYFETPVTVLDATTGSSSTTTHAKLSTLPVIVTGLQATWAEQALGNRTRPFPWGGDFSGARTVSLTAPHTEQGLHQFGQPVIRTFGGKPARDASTRSSQSFAVDPNFANYVTGPLEISITARRNGATSAGFKLTYESVSGWKSAGWHTVPAGETFTTKTFTVSDAQFVGNWGYHFTLESDSKANSQYSIESVTVTKLTAP